MSELHPLIQDLALTLVVAGIVTIIFKRLRQPLVLGYIMAGFLVSPHMPYTMSIVDRADIQTWADIGVIFLLFSLGLDFSFKKIMKMGISPAIAATTIISSMVVLLRLDHDGQPLSWRNVGHVEHHDNLQSLRRHGPAATGFRPDGYERAHSRGHPCHRYDGASLGCCRRRCHQWQPAAGQRGEHSVLPGAVVCGRHLCRAPVSAFGAPLHCAASWLFCLPRWASVLLSVRS